MSLVVESIEDDFLVVTGIIKGKSKEGKQYCSLQCLTTISFGDERLGFATSSFMVNPDYVSQYNIEVGDHIQPLFVGTGEYKKLKHIEVIKASNPFDKKGK